MQPPAPPGAPPPGGFAPPPGAPPAGTPPTPPGGFTPPPGAPPPPPGGFTPPPPPPGYFQPGSRGPVAPAPGGPASSVEPYAMGALGAGVVALLGNCCCFGIPIVAGILAVVLAFVSFSNLNKEPERYAESSKALAIIGVVIAAVGALLHIAAILFQFALPVLMNP